MTACWAAIRRSLGGPRIKWIIERKTKGTEHSTERIMAQRLVAEMMIETLVAAGVKRIYGVVGDSLNGLLEEIRRSEDIEWIGVRHEETAAFAAGAQAHLTASWQSVPEVAGQAICTSSTGFMIAIAAVRRCWQ